MATISQILEFVQTGTATVNGYTVYPVGASGVDNAFVKLVFGSVVEYYAFSQAVLKVIALSDNVTASENTNIVQYNPTTLAEVERYSKDATGVLQFEGTANETNFLFYIDPTVTDTSLQTFTTDPTRYSTKTAFNITVVNADNTTEDYAKTSNSNIIQSTGTTEQFYVVYDDLGFLQAATDKVVGTDGISRDVVVGNGIVKYVKPDQSVEYYRKAAVLDSNNQVIGSLPYFKQVNRLAENNYEDIAGPITWREYGTPDPDAITTYQFATNSNFVDGSLLVSGGYIVAGSTTPEPVRTFTRASSGVITEEVSNITHYYSYTNAGFNYSVQNAPVSNKINDIRDRQTKPISTSGVKVYDVVYPKVLKNSTIYYAFENHSTSDINVQDLANNNIYSIGEQLYYIDTYANSPSLSFVTSAYYKNADGLLNNLTISSGNVTGSFSSIYEAYKNIGVKSSAIIMNANNEVTLKNASLSEYNTIYVRDASSNLLQVKNSSPLTYISYEDSVSRFTFANATKYLATDILKQRTVDNSDATSDIVFDKLAPKAVNNNNESNAYAYSDLGLLGVAKTSRAFTSVKLVYPNDTIDEQTYIKYRDNVIRRTIASMEVYYDYTGNLSSLTLYEFTTDNATYPVSHQLNRSNSTTGEPIDWYVKQMDSVTEFSGQSPQEFLVYSEPAKASAILEENVSRIVPNNSLIHLITVGGNSLEASRLTHVKRNPGAARITTTGTNWEAHSNRGLEFIAADTQFIATHTATLISTSVVYSYYARNVLLNVAEYISYQGAVTRKNFATDKVSGDQKYANEATLKQRTVASDDSITDINFQKSLPNMVNHTDALVTYVYGELGLLSAATATTVVAYTTENDVKLVTGDNIIDDGAEVVSYTKLTVYANTLRLDTDKYYEYNSLASLTLHEFTTNATDFPVANTLYKQNTSTGANIESYTKKMIEGVSLLNASTPNEFFVYNESAKASAILEESDPRIVVNDSLIHLVTVDSVTKLETARLTHVKRNPGAARITTTGTNWEAHSNRGLEFIAADLQFISGHSATLISTSVVYSYYARNVLLNVAEYISYQGAVTRKNFATDKVGSDQKYAESATLKQRTVASDDSITDINFQKSLPNMVNHLDTFKTYVYGELGLLSAATATVVQAYITQDDVKLVTGNNIVDDGAEVVSYTKLTDYANTLRLDTDKYYEYNNLASLTLHEFTTNINFPVADTLYKQNTSTGASIESYTKKMIEGVSLLNASSPNQFFVYNESAKASAILEENVSRIVVNDSLIHLITVNGSFLEASRLTHVKRNPGAARITTTGTNWEAHSNRGLEFIAADLQFISGHSATLISTSVVYSYYARNVLLNVAEYISYQGAVTRKNFATDKVGANQKYAESATLKQRTVASNDSITDINFQKSLPNMVNHTDALVTYVYGELGLLSAATATVVQAYTTQDNVKLVTQNNIVDDGVEVVSYTKLTVYENTLRKDANKYYEYNNLASLTLYEFTTNINFNEQDILYKQNTSTGANVKSFTKTLSDGVTKEDGLSEFFVYTDDARKAAINENRDPLAVAIDSTIHWITVGAGNLEASRVDYIKRHVGASQSGSSWEAFNYLALAAIASDVHFLSTHHIAFTVIEETKTYLRDASNVLLEQNTNNYVAYDNTVLRKAYATNNVHYEVPGELRQRLSTTASNVLQTDVVLTKLGNNAVNRSIGGVDDAQTYVYGDLGKLTAARSIDSKATVRLVTADDVDGDATAGSTDYTKVSANILNLTNVYEEYDNLSSLNIRTFATTNSYNENDELHKMNTTTGSLVDTYSKVQHGIMLDVADITGEAENQYYVYVDRSVAADAPLAKVAVGAVIVIAGSLDNNEPAPGSDAYIKKALSLIQRRDANDFYAFDEIGLRSATVGILSTDDTVEYNGTTWTYVALNLVNHQTTYLTYPDSTSFLTEESFAVTVDYLAGDELLHRSLNSNTTLGAIATDITITKLAQQVVNTTADATYTHVWEIGSSKTGLKNAAQLADGSIKADILDKTNTVPYQRLYQYVLKKGANEYFEYNDLITLSLESFTTGSYNVNDILRAMNTTTGVQEHYYTKVLASGVSKKNATTTFFVFSEESKVSAITDATGAVNNGALINKMTSGSGEGVFDAAFYRRHLSAAQSVADITKWEAYSYIALANVSADSTFVNGHSVDFKIPSPISLITTYDRYASKVLKDQNESNLYIAYDNAGTSVVSEASFATTNSYGQVATLRQRLLTATSDSADIVISKLDYNLVNNGQVDSSATHAYGDLGLRNAAIRADASDLLNAKVKEVNASAMFNYIVQYVLQDASNNYYEYNALLTITLENFTTKLSETIVTASLSYPVGSILHKRDTTSGAKVNDYTKVMAGVSKIDSPPRTFYTFSVVDREAAIDQANNAIVPSSPPSTVYQTVAGVETVFYKTATSTAENLTATNTYEVGTYYALGQLAIGASDISGSTFDVGETVKFTDINKTYTLIAQGLLREVGTQIYIAYDGVVSRETFATTSYVVGATLVQRSSALTTPDTAVTDNDIVLSKIANSAVNRATNSLAPIYEDNTYAYGTLGLLNSAITATAKTTVKLVTQPDVANDGVEVVNYTKVEANVLRLDTDKYYDYSNLVSLSISRFVSEATYNVFDTLHKMNTTTGVEVTSYEKRLHNVAKDENNYYYVYGGDIVPAIQASFTNVPNDVTLILTSQNNEPTLNESTNNTYTKRDVGLLQVATSSAWQAYSLVALASCSANTHFLSGHSVELKEATSPYSLVETYDRYALKVLKVQSSLSYLAFDGVVSESQFATTDSYGEIATLIQRASSASDTTADITISKIAYDLVNTTTDANATHAHGARGLRNAAIRSDATDLKNATVIDKQDSDASYTYKLQYVLQDATNNYHEYNTLATITLRNFTLYINETINSVALSYPVGSILYAHHAITGVFVHSYNKILPKISKVDSPAYHYYVFSINDRIAAIDEDGTLIPISPRSTIHQILLVGGVDEETIYYKTQVGGAQDSRYPNVTPDYEVNSYYALGQQVLTNSEFVVGDTIKFTDLGIFYEKVGDKIVMELNSSPPKYIAYDNILSREGFATSATYAVNSILIQRSSAETAPDTDVTNSDIVLTKIAANAVNRGTDSLNTVVESVTYAYGTLGLLGSARSANAKSVVRLVTASDVDGDATAGVTNYDKVQANVLKLGTVYQEYDDLATITLRAFATTSSYNNDDTLKRMSTTDGVELDAYVKILSGIMKDAADQVGEESILYYAYNALADAANAPLNKIDVDDIIVDVTGDNEPDGTDMMNKSYIKKTLGLLRKNMTLTSRFFAFSHIGLRSAATGYITTGQTVDYDGTRWSYNADNLLKASTAYITFADASNSLSEIDFATLVKYVAGDSLTQRTVADLTSTSSSATDIVLNKLAVNVVNTTADSGKTHSYESIGLLNAAQLADDSGIQGTIVDMTNSIEYTRVNRYILLKVGTMHYYEFSEFATITLRTFATDPVYMVGGIINKMDLSGGAVVEAFTKYAADIILEAQGEYYCYVETSLATIANEDDTILPVGTVVYEMVSNNEHTASDLPWTKTERYVLRANHLTSNKQYKVYNNSALPLDEFACASDYAISDRIIQTFNSPYTIYDRKATSILDKDGDANGRYYSFYYAGVVAEHLELKESASNALVQVGDIVITMAGEEWTKDAEGILLRNGVYLTFEGSSLGASSFATGSYVNGSLLRLITDISANSSYYMKNLTGVLYNSVLDQYETYGSDGLKNVAQSEDLLVDRTPSDLMIVDAEKIELNVLIVNIATSTSFYKIQRYVLKASSSANYYDYSVAGNFGTITLEAFATDATYIVGATLQDMIASGGTWSKENADVIKQSTTYYSYSDAGNAWTAANGIVSATVEEKTFNNVVYSILEKGVLLSNNIYYAYNIVSDVNGLTLLTFSTSTSTYPNITLVDRTSTRVGVTYVRHSTGLLKTEDNNYLAMNATGLQTYATTTIAGVTPSTTVVESSAGSWTTSVRVTYTLYLANILKNASNSTLYVYNLSALSLNTFATSSSYALGDILVDRSSTYDGPNYKKMIAGVLERKATLTAFADIEMLTFENDANGVKGLENASLAEVGDISDGTILIPDVPAMPKYLRCAKALLRAYMSQASGASFDNKALVFEQSGSDSPLSILSTVALNTGLVGNSQIPSETKLYVQPWGGAGYNTSTYAFVKDSAPFTNTIRVGTSAISDKITYAPADGTRASVLANFCELDSNGSRTSSNSTAVYNGKTITVRTTGDVVYTLPRRGLLLTGSSYYAFSQYGLVAAAVDADTVLNFYYYYTSGDVELLEQYRRIRRGLLLSSSQVSGQAGLSQSTTAILYYNDYSTNPDDNPANMYYYLYKLATQRSVGGATSDTATFGRDASGNLVQTASTGDSIIDGIASGTITSLYGIVTTVGGIASAQRYSLISDVSNALLVDNLDSTPDFYLAYGADGLSGNYDSAQDGLKNLTNAVESSVPSGSIFYTADRYAVYINNSYKYTKIGEGVLSAPGGVTYTYNATGLSVFANQALSTRSSALPRGVAGTDSTSQSRSTLGGKTYFWWEQGVIMYIDTDGSQVFEVYPPNGPSNFIKRVALARANGGTTQDYNDSIASNPAFTNGTRIVIRDDDDLTNTGDVTYIKVDEGLIRHSAGQHYAFSNYGIASAANQSPAISDVIEMGGNINPLTTSSPVWTVMTDGVVKNSTVWRLYTNGSKASGREYFARNSDLNNTMSYFTYAHPNTTTLQNGYTNVFDGTVNTVNTALLRISPVPVGEKEFQTYGNAGLALVANNNVSGLLTNKTTDLEVYAITGDASNNVTGVYRKLQDGALYTGTVNSNAAITLFNDNLFQQVLDRFDIIEFVSLNATNGFATKTSATALNLNPLERLIAKGSELAASSTNITINGTTYSTEQVLERDILSSGSYVWTSELPATPTATDEVVASVTVTNKNGSVMTFRYRRSIRPVSIVS